MTNSRFFRCLMLLLISLFSSAGNAQSQPQPWLSWTRNPLTIPVKVAATNLMGDAGMKITLHDKSVTQMGAGASVETNSAPAITDLKVRREYTLTVVATNLTSAKLMFDYQPNWVPINRRGRAAQPKTYRLMVDRAPENDWLIDIPADAGPYSYYSNSWTIELTERLPSNWRMEDGSDDPEPAAGDGKWAEIGPGKSLDKARAAISWSVGLGRLIDGTAAGRLTLREPGLSTEIYTPTNIYYTAGSEVVRDQVELVSKEPTSPVLRQVKAVQAFVDIVPLVNATELRFYHTNQVGTATNSLGHYTSISGNPFVVWALINPEPSTTNKLHIVERRNGLNRTNEIVFEPNASPSKWTLRYGTAPNQRVETREVTISQGVETNRIEVIDIRYSGATNPAYRAIEKYKLYPWGRFELVEVRIDPDNNTGTANDLVTSMSFYDDIGYPESYGKLKWIKHPDGYWEKRTYYDTDDFYYYFGALWRVFSPWADGPSDPEFATVENSVFQEYQYDPDTGCSFHVATYGPEGGGLRSEVMLRNIWNGYDQSFNYTSIGESAGGPRQVGRLKFLGLEDEGFGYFSHTHSEWATGEIPQSSYFQFGTYNTGNHTFSPAPEMVFGPDWRRSTVFTGEPVALSYYDIEGIVVPYIEGEYLHYDYGLPPTLFPNRSWREASIYQKGSLVQKDMQIFTGVDTNGEPQFDFIGKWIYQNDSLGRATNVTFVWTNGNTALSRVIYSADYKGTNSVDGELLLWEMDEFGVRTTYTYDSLKRVASQTKEGLSSGLLPQPGITNSYTYDAYGRVLSETTSSDTLTLSSSTIYDLSGRTNSVTSANGLTTQYAHELGGRRTIVTLPNTATITNQNYVDRRLKSITGNGAVNEFHEWINPHTDPDPSWLHVVLVDLVRYGTNNSIRTNSIGLDWHGRPIRFERADYHTNSPIVEYRQYTSSHEAGPSFVYRTPRMVNGSLGDCVEAYRYDLDGKSTNSFHIIPPNDFFFDAPESSRNRIMRSFQIFEKQGTSWFQVTTNITYLTNNDATATMVGGTRKRLSGFSNANVVSEITTWDADTNLTVVTTTVNRADKLVTELTDVPYSTDHAARITINGLLHSETTTSVQQPVRYGYDALGRQTSITNSLNFVSHTRYNHLGQVTNVVDFNNVTTEYEYYGNGVMGAGELKTETIGGKRTYYAYTSRGELHRKWGDVPYPEERTYSIYGELKELRTYQGGTSWNNPSWDAINKGTPNLTTWTYEDTSGLLLSKTDHLNRSVSYTYTNGWVRTRTWARSPSVTTTKTYNDLGELLAVSYSDGTPGYQFTNTVETFGYNRIGRPILVSDASGEWQYRYDRAGRSLGVACIGGTFNGITVTNRFDPVYGRDLLRIEIAGQSAIQQSYAYEASGRLKSANYAGYSATYDYLPNSDLLRTNTFKNGASAKLISIYQWENGSRLKSIHNRTTDTFSSHTYDYDNLNRRWKATLWNNSYWQYGYNDRNEVVSGKHYWSDTTPAAGQQFEYFYDNIGNRDYANTGGNSSGTNLRQTDYSANGLNQYSSITTPGYEDILGIAAANTTISVVSAGVTNATSRKADYYHCEVPLNNASGPVWQQLAVQSSSGGSTNGNVLLPPASQSPSYDLDGNLLGDGLWSYAWDAENRLKSMESVSTVPNAAKRKLEFGYDYQGRRITKKVYTWNSSWTLSSHTRFVYDGWNLAAELDGSNGNALVRSYLWGNDLSGTIQEAGGIGGLLIVRDHSSSSYHFAAYDGNGNLVGLVNASDQSLSAQYEYSPFGETLRATGPISKFNPFQWSSKYHDWETGLIYYGYRYYSPNNGRWVNRDPLGEDGGLNIYGFAGNDPINRYDPDGRLAPVIVAAAYLVFEITMAAYDLYDAWDTITDPDSTITDYTFTAGGLIVGGVAPGPGSLYGKAAKEGFTRLTGDALVKARREFSNLKPDLWRLEAQKNPHKYTWEQLADMKSGKAPKGSDGKPMEIHHKQELAAGGNNSYENMEFLTFTEHRGKGNFKKNHPNIFPD